MAYGSVKVDTIVYDNSGSDASIAVSGIPTASDLNAKADLASPALTGNPTAPTQSANDDSTKIATTAYVQTELEDYALQSAVNAKAPINSPAFTADIELSAQAPLKFMDADSSNYVAFRAPATVGSNVTWTLPATDAAGSLTSDGSGNLSWVAGSAGTSLGLAIALG